ncbi:MAG: DNA mismatch repair endonuclease MutL [Anaerolineae bacterium]|jgi:DNA mismatch repair protein MutL|nr:DNA mismatch repair endonuclease MutL [Anaerolineae bacterium]MDH7473878.1 DNA mismatch repair endonuclease MutL [Anaerolineae bacterium]
MTIRVLPPEVAAKIAAGEVVERPASVVKELIENAIDAGATEIRIEVRQGGKRLIRVADNGCGIPSAEVELAFARHSTSKLSSVEDLTRIITLGFRGEALASIAAVSHLTMLTRPADEPVGSYLRLEGGNIINREGRGCPVGTMVTVENLFYNIPARLKFLRSETTERQHIDQLITRYAMAYPQLRFSVTHEGRLTFQSTGSGQLSDVLIKVYGLEVAGQMLAVSSSQPRAEDGPSEDGQEPRVSGYVSVPTLHRANRDHLTFFVNGRWVRDRMLTHAVEQAYHTLLPVGRHPLAVLRVDLAPAELDVNIHPAKSEVKFLHSERVFATVQKAVRRTLVEQAPIPVISPQSGQWTAADWERRQALITADRERLPTQLALDAQRPGEFLTPAQQAEDKLPPLRVLGQVARTYIIAEGPSGLYLIDQHAAHERILYEQLIAQKEQSPAQALLEPTILELTPDQIAVMEEQLPVLTRLGFTIEPFGGSTYLVRAVPAVLVGTDLRQALAGIVDELAEGRMSPLAHEREKRVIASVCKQAAIKAGQVLSDEELRELIRQLEATTMPRTCPHGRPTMIHLSQAQLEREFGRR